MPGPLPARGDDAAGVEANQALVVRVDWCSFFILWEDKAILKASFTQVVDARDDGDCCGEEVLEVKPEALTTNHCKLHCE